MPGISILESPVAQVYINLALFEQFQPGSQRISSKRTGRIVDKIGFPCCVVMPQARGPWDKLQLVSGGIRKGSGQAGSLSYPAAQAIAPETEALRCVQLYS